MKFKAFDDTVLEIYYICKPRSWHLILEPEDQLTEVKHLSLLICSWSLKTEWQLTLDIFDKQNKTVTSLDLMTATDWTKNDTGYSLVKPNFWSNGSQDKMYEYCTILSTDWVNQRETYMNLMNILMGTKCFGTCTSSDQMYYTSIYLFFTIFKKNKSVYFLDSLRITVNRFHAKQTDSLQKYASFWWTLWYSLIVHWNMLCTNVLIYCYLL